MQPSSYTIDLKVYSFPPPLTTLPNEQANHLRNDAYKDKNDKQLIVPTAMKWV